MQIEIIRNTYLRSPENVYIERERERAKKANVSMFNAFFIF